MSNIVDFPGKKKSGGGNTPPPPPIDTKIKNPEDTLAFKLGYYGTFVFLFFLGYFIFSLF